MNEGIPDIQAVRAEKIRVITQPIEEVCHQHLESHYKNLVFNWIKKDNASDFEFTVEKYPATSTESTEDALIELLAVLRAFIEPELSGYTFYQSDMGIRLLRD